MDYPRYSPEIVLITGATGDFGKAFARRFAKNGSKLIIHGRNQDKVDALCAELDTPCHKLVFDMTDKQASIDSLKAIPADFRSIDLLINNAGCALGQDKAQESELDDWEAMIEINNKGLVRITNLVLPGMAQQKKGHIINIGSIAGNYPYPGGHVYCAAKAFTKQFSLSLRADLAGTNVRVTNIEPGMVETQFSEVRFKGDKAKADAVYANTTPLTADDVAESVFWAATLPPYFNINRMELMPTTQAFGPFAVERHG